MDRRGFLGAVCGFVAGMFLAPRTVDDEPPLPEECPFAGYKYWTELGDGWRFAKPMNQEEIYVALSGRRIYRGLILENGKIAQFETYETPIER